MAKSPILTAWALTAGLLAQGFGPALPKALGQPGGENPPPAAFLITNARIFDGKSDKVTEPTSVLVVGDKIAKVGESIDAPEGATVLDAGGRVLMPGLIDAHVHLILSGLPMNVLLTADASYIHLVAGTEAEATLLRGFTTVRDAGGPTFGLKRAIDEGKVPGPRIYPSGAFLSQTSGHGDFRNRWELPRAAGEMSRAEQLGMARIADGVPEVTRAAREQLLLGATQIKVMAGGGVISAYDPLDTTQYTEEELRAAVKAADNWGTYVTVHAYTPEAIRQSIAAGVKCIEHGHLMDEETAKFIHDKGVWLSSQPFLAAGGDSAARDPASRKKMLQVTEGTDTTYRLARKHKLKLAWGTDILFSSEAGRRQGTHLVNMGRWFEPHEVLRMATSDNAALLGLSGKRNPYPGKLGVIEEGAYADLLVVDGNPLEDLKLIQDPWKNFLVIMKDGKIYKNKLK